MLLLYFQKRKYAPRQKKLFDDGTKRAYKSYNKITRIERKSKQEVERDQQQEFSMYNQNLNYEATGFDSIEELVKLMSTESDTGTVVHATTGFHYDWTSEGAEDSGEGAAVDPEKLYANGVSKFFNPTKTKLCAIVAVGIRYARRML